jgi:hypothetical protein
MAVLGRGGPQNPSTTPHRHVFPQSDFGRHGERQFHDRAFRERRLGVKENSTATQILSKSGRSPFPEVNRQRQIHFETLRASSFQTMFKTIRICVHRRSLPDPVRGSVTSAQCTLTLSRIGPGGKFQMGGVSVSRLKPQDPAPPRPRSISKFLVLRRFLRVPSCPWWLMVSQLTHDQMPSSLAVIPKM